MLLRANLKLVDIVSVCSIVTCFSGADLELIQCLRCLWTRSKEGILVSFPSFLGLSTLSLKELVFLNEVQVIFIEAMTRIKLGIDERIIVLGDKTWVHISALILALQLNSDSLTILSFV